MVQIKKRIRKSFEPLKITANIQVLQGTYGQQYIKDTDSVSPDREDEPLILFPAITAKVTDGSWQNDDVNILLANMKWYVGYDDDGDRIEISNDSTWSGKYTITTSGSQRGAISITKNIDSANEARLWFECDLPDPRTLSNIHIVTDNVVLYTADSSDDDWSMSIDNADSIIYNPLDDKWFIYDHKIANNISAIEPTDNLGSYKLRITPLVYKGLEEADSSLYDLSLYSIGGDGAQTFIQDIDELYLDLDLRLIERSTFLIVCKVGNKKVTQKQFTIKRANPKYTLDMRNMGNISNNDKYVYSKAILTYNKKILEYPDIFFEIEWFTDSAYRTNVSHGYGENISIDLNNTGIGNVQNDSYLDVYFQSETKPNYDYMIDEVGNFFVDENGNKFINN